MPIETCSVNLPPHEIFECNRYKLGGISGFALIKTDYVFVDITDNAEWVTAIGTGDIRIVNAIKGDVPAATASEFDSLIGCDDTTVVAGMDHIFNFQDKNVKVENDDFYGCANGRRFNLVWYECADPVAPEIVYVQRGAQVIAPPATVPGTIKEPQAYIGQVKWFTPQKWSDVQTRHDATTLAVFQ